MWSQVSLLLLPVAATWGWFVAKKEKNNLPKTNSRLRHDYFQGLNYLINQQPDKAVDVFTRLLEVDSDTIETHLALGNLFRQRGEVDRAIRIHQNLIARPQLDKHHRVQALLALGQDYLRAGVLDRAEELFLELVKIGEENQQSLKFLLQIYQQEKDWRQAIETAKKLEKISKESKHKIIAQYHCELAEIAIENNQMNEAKNFLNIAAAIDGECVRASLLRGNIENDQYNYRNAIQYYQKVKDQDPDYLLEVLKPLAYCYKQLQEENKFVAYLNQSLPSYPRVSLVVAIAEQLREEQGDKAAIQFLVERIRNQPSLRGLHYLIGLHLASSHGDTFDKLSMLQHFIHKLLEEKPIYQCGHCGFAGKILYWLCPSCHNWSTVKPIQGIEGN